MVDPSLIKSNVMDSSSSGPQRVVKPTQRKRKALWWVDQKEVEREIIFKKLEFIQQRQDEFERMKEMIRHEFEQNNEKVAKEVVQF